MLLCKKKILAIAIATICSSIHIIRAEPIIWTDADFTSPKGITSVTQDTTLQNNQTAKFEGYMTTNNSIFTIQDGATFIAEGNIESTNTGTMGDSILAINNAKGTFNGDVLANNANTDNGFFTIVSRDYSELHFNGKTTINGQRGTSATNNSSSTFNDFVEINSAISGVNVEQNSTMNFKDINVNMDNSGIDQVSYGVRALNSGQINVDSTLNINIDISDNNNWAYGAVSAQQSTVNLQDANIIFTNNQKTGGEVGLYSASGSQLNIDGNLTILNSDPYGQYNYAIYASAGDITSTNAKTNIQGSFYADNSGQINLDMANGSQWMGASGIDSNGQINLTMDTTNWSMINSSDITSLNANNSHIRFLSSSNNFFTLNTQDLLGANNRFTMNTDLGSISSAIDSNGERIGTAGVNGDLLVISGNNTATNNTLFVTNNGSAATQGNEVLQIVSTTSNNQGDFHLASAVEAGGYQYALRQSTDPTKTGWELFSTGQTSTTAKAAVNSYFNVSYLLSYIDNQTLLQRMGELRDSEGKQGNFWVRTYGGKLNSFGGQKLDGFDMTYTGTQLGIDKQLQLSSGDLYLGLMASYAKADPDYKSGSGTANSFSTGGYLTYLDNNGFYFDTVLKYTNIRNKFSVKDSQNLSVEGRTKSNGYGLSFEVGRQFKLADTHFYIEPQLQLAYQYQDGDKASATNGLEIKMDSYNSVLGRASGIIGYKMTDSKNLQLNLYAKTGIVQEFAGDTSYRLNGNKEKYSFNGAWFDNGIGVNAKINNRHNIYGELDYSTGHRFDKAQASIGYRFEF